VSGVNYFFALTTTILPVNDNYSLPCGRREAPLPDLFRNVPPCTVEATPRVHP
jgi:hypothetical protein